MTTAQAIKFDQVGGPEVLHLVNQDIPAPGPGEALVRHSAIGLNFIDVYHRTGLYPVPLPSGLGVEGAERRAAEDHPDADGVPLLDLVEGGVGVSEACAQGQSECGEGFEMHVRRP